MKIETTLKNYQSNSQQNRQTAAGLKIKSSVKAGSGEQDAIASNHNQTVSRLRKA